MLPIEIADLHTHTYTERERERERERETERERERMATLHPISEFDHTESLNIGQRVYKSKIISGKGQH